MGYKSHISDEDCEPSWTGFAVASSALVLGCYVGHWTGNNTLGFATFISFPFVLIATIAGLRKIPWKKKPIETPPMFVVEPPDWFNEYTVGDYPQLYDSTRLPSGEEFDEVPGPLHWREDGSNTDPYSKW